VAGKVGLLQLVLLISRTSQRQSLGMEIAPESDLRLPS
jgi:hypothetical protein